VAPGEIHRPRLGALTSGEAKRDALWRLRTAAALAALALAIELLYVVLASPRFAIREVVLRGDARVIQEVAPRIRLPANTNILRAPVRLLKRQVESFPAVQQARVARSFPGRLVVTAQRREPVAVIRRAEQAILIDPEGMPFTVSDEGGWGLPELVAPHLASGDIEGEEASGEISALLAVLRALGPDPRLRTTRLQLVDEHRLEVTLESRARVNLGERTQLDAKAKLLTAALDQIGADRIDYLDLAYPAGAFWLTRKETVSAVLR